MIAGDTRTEELLKQSQALTDELQKANSQLQEKAGLLAEQKAEVEERKLEVELGKRALEEKAEQLALTSKYKSDFLANMSHELRTPLNSMLILPDPGRDQEGKLTPKQIEFATTIHSSGHDLLALINDILDLSKIESGTVDVYPADVRFTDVRSPVERIFRQVAESKGVDFTIELGESLPNSLYTDGQRVEQVLKNLLSNAFKFTERGRVSLRIEAAVSG